MKAEALKNDYGNNWMATVDCLSSLGITTHDARRLRKLFNNDRQKAAVLIEYLVCGLDRGEYTYHHESENFFGPEDWASRGFGTDITGKAARTIPWDESLFRAEDVFVDGCWIELSHYAIYAPSAPFLELANTLSEQDEKRFTERIVTAGIDTSFEPGWHLITCVPNEELEWSDELECEKLPLQYKPIGLGLAYLVLMAHRRKGLGPLMRQYRKQNQEYLRTATVGPESLWFLQEHNFGIVAKQLKNNFFHNVALERKLPPELNLA